MRTLEALLLLADLLAFCGLWVARLRGRRGLRLLPAVALMAAATQVLVEGPRWPMGPAYALAAGLLLTGLLQRRVPARAHAGPIVRHPRGAALAIGLGVLAWAAAAALPWAVPVFRFPIPAGPHAIGTVAYHWTDGSRSELFGADPAAGRQLMVQAWYPALAKPMSARARYLQDADAVMAAFAHSHGQPAWVFAQFKHVTTHALPAAAVASDAVRYPVLLFLEGATGFRQMNTFQVEHLVSHGYIVVALDQPGAAAAVRFPDGQQIDGLTLAQFKATVGPSYLPAAAVPSAKGRLMPNGSALAEASIIPYLAQDVVFALDQLAAVNQADPHRLLTGKLDLQRVAAFGVSLGGIVAAEACRLDARLRACLLMDAPMPTDVVDAGLRQPSLWLTRDAASMRLERQAVGGWPDAEIDAHQRTMRAAYERGSGAGYLVQMPGAFHSNFTDAPLWTPLAALWGLSGPIGGQRAHDIINAYGLAFFDRHLLGRPASLLDETTGRGADVLFEARGPDPAPPAAAKIRASATSRPGRSRCAKRPRPSHRLRAMRQGRQ